VSVESRVVPGIFETIQRSEPKSLFIKDDFPTLGFPITAIRIALLSNSGSIISGRRVETASINS